MNVDRFAAALVDRARELHARGELTRPAPATFDIERLAMPVQLKVRKDPSRNQALCCGRQSGKTTFAGWDHHDYARSTPASLSLFIAPNRLWAKRIIWDDYVRLVQQYDPRVVVSISDLSFRYPNGSIFALMGADTDKERAKIRGRSYGKITLDEAQAFPFWLDDFIREDVRPAQRNVRGVLRVQGTPPASLEHPWFKKIWNNPAFSRHSWNITHWPRALYKAVFGRSAEEAIAEDLRDRGVGPDDVTFRREMLGEFLADESALAYRFDVDKNTSAAPDVDVITIGVDLGWHDATVVCVLGWRDGDPTVHQLHEEVHDGITLTDLAGILKRLSERFSPALAFVDSGGNRQGFETIKEQLEREGVPLRIERRPVLPVADQVGLVNQALQAGRLKLLPDSRAASDMRLVTWKRGIAGTKLDDGYHSDAIPALTYAYQAAAPLLPAPPEQRKAKERSPHPPGFDPEEWARKAASNKPWWEIAEQGDSDAAFDD